MAGNGPRQASTLETVESSLGAIDLWGQDLSQWAGLAEAISDQLSDMGEGEPMNVPDDWHEKIACSFSKVKATHPYGKQLSVDE